MVMPPGDSGWHPRMSSRLGQFRLVQMSGSHEALFTNPIGLADKLIEALLVKIADIEPAEKERKESAA